jgi:D-aspartate ligase
LIEISNTSVPIVILQAEPSLQHGGLGIARTAGRLGIRVYWVRGQASWAPAALSRYVHGTFCWNVSAPAEASVEYLLACSRQIGHQPILIPIGDTDAVFVADHAEALKEGFLYPDQPAGLARALSNKKEMHHLCKKVGVPTPEAVFPQSVANVATFAETAAFPIVMKRIARWVPEHRPQMKSVTIVNSSEELLREYGESETSSEPNVMLQEYIPGSPEDVWMYNGYFTDSSECLAGFTGKKIRQAHTGMTSLGVCLENETVEESATDFLRRIGYSGVVDMDYRYDHRDGHYKLLDVNPRVGWTFRLFVDSNGMDVVRALYLDLTGQPVQRRVAREGRKWIVEQNDLMSSLHYGRLGKLTLREWARSLRGIEEGTWFARDDLVPFAAMCWTSLTKVGRMLATTCWTPLTKVGRMLAATRWTSLTKVGRMLAATRWSLLATNRRKVK